MLRKHWNNYVISWEKRRILRETCSLNELMKLTKICSTIYKTILWRVYCWICKITVNLLFYQFRFLVVYKNKIDFDNILASPVSFSWFGDNYFTMNSKISMNEIFSDGWNLGQNLIHGKANKRWFQFHALGSSFKMN